MIAKQRILIVLWTTGRCNLSCKYCYAGLTDQTKDMEFETATRMLDQFSDYAMKVQFAGGEPLLNYVLICRIYEYVKTQKYDVSFQMQTNGTCITPEIAAGIKRMKIALGVSLDGPPDTNEYLRGNTKDVIAGIQCLVDEDIKINLNSVVTSYNVEKLPKLVNFAFYLGNVAGIGLDLLRETGRARAYPGVIKKATPEQLKTALIGMVEASRELYELTGKKNCHSGNSGSQTAACEIIMQ